MEIKIIQGDLVKDVVEQRIQGHIMHGCNAQGSMGAGIALQIKKQLPVAYEAYMKAYRNKGLMLGDAIPARLAHDTVLWNIISQEVTGRDPNSRYVSYDGIDSAMRKMRNIISERGNTHIPNKLYFPLIGCGLANGRWPIVSSIIQDHFGDFELFLYEYQAR